jgi:hypothetical protein
MFMTFLAILVFSAALCASVATVIATIGDAIPRISEVIEAEFAPVLVAERKVHFGPMKRNAVAPLAKILSFPSTSPVSTDFKLAA